MGPCAALLLRAVDYGERDRIVTCLTAVDGQVSLLARGARGSRRRFAGGALEPFAVLRLGYRFGRGELGQLQEASVDRAFSGILRDLQKMYLAGTALELVRALAPARQPDPDLFAGCVRLFEALDVAEAADDALLFCFELHVLALSGLAPRLDACGRSGRRPPPGRAAYFDPREGSIIAGSEGGGPLLLSGATRAAWMRALTGAWVEASRGWSDKQREESRAALRAFVEYRLERPLRGARSMRCEPPSS